MRIFYSEYELSQERRGALLQFHFDEDLIGYADCHPWEELGDHSLKEQLRLLSQGKFTPLTKRSFAFARMDSEARAQGLNLFKGLTIPPSHWFLKSLDEEVPEGFTRCKIKLGKKPEEEVKRLPYFFQSLPENVLVRLDFNRRMTEGYLSALKPYLHQIAFIEDPVPFHREAWSALANLKLACDRDSEKYLTEPTHQITVLKPAIQDCLSIFRQTDHHLVCTSYLDHPLGQVAAAYIAANLPPQQLLHCGLLTHHVYQTNQYSEQLSVKGEQLVVPDEGTGFGFDEQLKNEKWKEL